jgi:hypothetical protein
MSYFMRRIAFAMALALNSSAVLAKDDPRHLELVELWRSAANCSIGLSPATIDWIEAMVNTAPGEVTGRGVDAADKAFAEASTTKQIVSFCWTTRDRLRATGLL